MLKDYIKPKPIQAPNTSFQLTVSERKELENLAKKYQVSISRLIRALIKQELAKGE